MSWSSSNLTGKIKDPRAAQTAEGVTQPNEEIEWMNTINADNYFAILPEWILYSDISATAIRLYAVLRRRADKNTSQCYPTRKSLAKDLRVGSLSTVDRAMKELVEIGAVKVFHRKNGDEYTSNIYTIITATPYRKSGEVASNLQVGSLTDDEQTKVIKPKTSNQRKDMFNEFEQFWNVYPRKQGKGAARESFMKALGKTTLDVILTGARNYSQDPNRKSQFTTLPATWLNQERWDDEPLPSRESGSEKFLKEFRQESAWLELE